MFIAVTQAQDVTQARLRFAVRVRVKFTARIRVRARVMEGS